MSEVSNTNSLTNEALITSATGENITQADKQILSDFTNLSPESFVNTYGIDLYRSLDNQAREVSRAADIAQGAHSRFWDQAVTDTAKNVGIGAVSGATDLASFTTGLLGMRGLSKGLASASEGIREFGENLGSVAEQAQRNYYEFEQRGLKNRLDREYKEDIASGKSETQAKLSYMGKEFMGSAKNAFSTGYASELGGQGIGSTLLGGPTSKIVTKGAQGIKALMPATGKAVQAFAQKGKTAQKLVDNAPWMLSMGMQEGGGAFTQELTDLLNSSTEDLQKNSPEFRARFEEYKAQGLPEAEASQKAKEDIAFAAAKEAGMLTGLAATGANYMTAPLGKIVRGDQKLSKFIAEALPEVPEETITEGLGQVAQNLATKHYANENQDLTEGVGESAALGGVGGLGMTGFRGATTAVEPATKMLADVTSKGTDYAENLIDQHKQNKEEKKQVAKDLEFASASNDLKEADLSSSLPGLTNVLAENEKHSADVETAINNSQDPEKANTSVPELFSAVESTQVKLDNLDKDDYSSLSDENKTKFEGVKKTVASRLTSQKQRLGKAAVEITSSKLSSLSKLDTSPQTLNLVGQHLTGLTLTNPSKSKEYYDSLPIEVKDALPKASFSSPLISKTVNNLSSSSEKQTSSLKVKSANSRLLATSEAVTNNSNTSPASSSISTPEVSNTNKTNNTAPATTKYFGERTINGQKFNYKTPALESPIPKEQLTPLPSLDFPDGAINLYIDRDKNVIFEDSSGQRKYRPRAISNQELASFYNIDPSSLSAEELKQYKFDYIIKDGLSNILEEVSEQEAPASTSAQYSSETKKPSSKEESFEVASKEANTSTNVKVSGDTFEVEGKTYELSEDSKKVFSNPEASLEEKEAAIASEFEDVDPSNVVSTERTRQEVNLDPDKLAEEGKYVVFDENGEPTVGEFDSDEVAKTFTEKLGEKFSALFKPMKRYFHLVAQSSPIEAFSELLQDRERFSEYLHKEGFTNTEALLNLLYDDDTEAKAFRLNNKNLAGEIITQISKHGPIYSAVQESLAKFNSKLLENSPQELAVIKNLLYKSDGSLKPEVVEIITIAAAQWLTTLSKYAHEMSAEELRNKLGINLAEQDDSFSTSKGIPSVMALQSFTSTIRKFLGVAPTNTATDGEINKVLGALASNLAVSFKNRSLLELLEEKVLLNEAGAKKTKSLWLYKGIGGTEDVFSKRADIIESILDPNYKNRLHLSPVTEVTKTISHSAEPASSAQVKTIMRENARGYTLNVPFLGFLSALGGEEGLNKFFGWHLNERNIDKFYTTKRLQSIKGQGISRRLGFDLIREALLSSKDPIEKIKVFFDHVALRNGRINQVGAATYQNNKLLRILLNPSSEETTDLSDTSSDIFNAWKTVLAQNLGRKVNRESFEDYSKDIDAVIEFIDNSMKSAKYSKLFKAILSPNTSSNIDSSTAYPNLYEDLKSFMKDFNEKFSNANLELSDNFETLNALLEIARYNSSSKDQRKSFTSRVYLEIDGINDGPSRINRMYGIAIGAFTPEFIRNQFKTGYIPGLNANSQKLADPNSPETKLAGSGGNDMHSEVSKEKIVESFLDRYFTTKKAAKESNIATKHEAQLLLRTFDSLLTVFQAVGWLSKASLDELNSMDSYEKGNPSKYPIGFSRDLSKVLTTVIPYGSQVRGSADQVLERLLTEIHTTISNQLLELGKSSLPDDLVSETTEDQSRTKEKILAEAESLYHYIVQTVADIHNTEQHLKELIKKETNQEQLKTYRKNLANRIKVRANLVYKINKYEKLNTLYLNNPSKNTLKEFNTWISETLKPIQFGSTKKAESFTLNGVPYKTFRTAFKNLFSITLENGNYVENKVELKNPYFNNLPSVEPTLEDILPSLSKSDRKSLKQGNREEDIRGFTVHSEGKQLLRENLVYLFSEPAQIAVEQTISSEAMRASKFVMVLGNLASIIQMGVRALLEQKEANGDLTSISRGDKYKIEKQVRKAAPVLKYSGGAKVFAEKKSISIADKALITNSDSKESGAFDFYPSNQTTTLAGLSFGALSTQGLGDATTVYGIENELQKLGIAIGQVFDGMYTAAKDIKNVSKACNRADQRTSKQKPFTDILSMISRIGKEISIYTNESDGVKSFIKAVSNLASGKNIDGTPLSTKDAKAFEDFYYEVERATSFINEAIGYDPNLLVTESKRIPSRASYRRLAPQTKAMNTSAQLTELFDALNCMVFAEKIKHQIYDEFPQVFHHMSGAENTVTQGKVLTSEEWETILKDINAQGPKFITLDNLLSAYLNARLLDKLESLNKTNEPLPKGIYKFFGFDAGNSGVVIATKEQVEIVNKALNIKDTNNNQVFEPNDVNRSTRTVSRRELGLMFREFRKSRKLTGIFDTLFKNIIPSLPEDVTVKVVMDRSSLPKDVKKHFTNAAQRGVYIPQGTKATIYVIGNKGSLDLTDPENMEVLAHECIHAVVSSKISDYYNNPDSLSDIQRNAIYNLERLLEDFDNLIWPDNAVTPEIISRLKEIINDPQLKQEEKLDEALAYILTNAKVFDALSKVGMDTHTKDKHKNNYFRLVNKLLDAAKHVWRRLLGTIFGVPTEEMSSATEKDLRNHLKSVDFLSLYGANTLVLITSLQNQKGDFSNKGSRKALTFSPERGYKVSTNTKDNLVFKTFTDTALSNKKELANTLLGAALATSKDLSKKVRSNFNQRLTELDKFKNNIKDSLSSLVGSTIAEKVAEDAIQFMDPDYLSSDMKSELASIYSSYLDTLDTKSFAKTTSDLQKSHIYYQMIVGEHPNMKKNVFTKVPEYLNKDFMAPAMFYALAKNVAQVRENLPSISIKRLDPGTKRTAMDLVGKLEDFSYGKLVKNLTEKYEGKKVPEVLKSMEDSFLKSREARDKEAKNLFDALDSKLESGLANLLASLISALGSITKSSKLNSLPGIIKKIPSDKILATEMLGTGLRNVVNSASFMPLWAIDWLKDFYGRLPKNQVFESLLKEVKGYADHVRKAKLEQTTDLLVKAFKNNKVDKKLRKLLDWSLGQTDITALDEKVAIKCLSSDTERQAEILKLEALLKDSDPELFNLYKAKMLQLADYLTGSRKSGHNLLKNADAIANLVGEARVAKISDGTVRVIDQLTTLYAINNLSKEDLAQMKHLFETDADAMHQVFSQLKVAYEKEYQRTDKKDYLYTRLKGARPEGTQPTGLYRIIPKSKLKEYKKRGYTLVSSGEFKASDIDTSEPMVRVFNKYPHEREFSEGILQTIAQTAFGFQLANQTTGEALGTKVTNYDAVKNAIDKFKTETSDEGLIPLYNSKKQLYGFERCIPPADRELIEGHRDLLTSISQYRIRQDRESIAGNINQRAVDAAWDDWNNAPLEHKKTQFIDVLHSSNTTIKDSVSRIDPKTMERIKEKFGNHFYVRKDLVFTILGSYRASATDIWENKTILPKPVEDAIVKCLEAVFGDNAQKFLGLAESGVMGIASFARDSIVIRSGFVALANFIGNVVLLTVVPGIPITKLPSLYKKTFLETQRLDKLFKRAVELKYMAENAKTSQEKSKYLKEYNRVASVVKSSPLYEMIIEGEYSTISPEGIEYEEVENLKANFDTYIQNFINKANGRGQGIKQFLSEALMLRGSDMFKLGMQSVNYGDWLAKAVGVQYLTSADNHFGKKMNFQEAKNLMSTMYVDYDQPAGRGRDYANRIGLSWFLTFAYRITKAAFLGTMINPSRMLLATLLANSSGAYGTPVTDNLLTKISNGNFGIQAGFDTLIRGLFLNPVGYLLNLIAR